MIMYENGTFAFEQGDITASQLTVLIPIFVVFAIVTFAIWLVLYILEAIAIYKMSVTAGINNPWMAFIPVANSYTYGLLAEKYQKRDGTKSARFSIILLILKIVAFIIGVVTSVYCIKFFVFIFKNINLLSNNDNNTIVEMFNYIIPMIAFSLIAWVVAMVYVVFRYIALWRIFSSFDYSSATLFTILSIFFSFLEPIFLFIIRNKPSTFEYSQRMGYFTNNY